MNNRHFFNTSSILLNKCRERRGRTKPGTLLVNTRTDKKLAYI